VGLSGRSIYVKNVAMSKQDIYQSLLPQIESLISGEPDFVARMANVSAVLHDAFGFWWTGFYRVDGNELVLGPFQGPVACMRIPFGRGVCGTAWQKAQTIIVPDVHQFAGHIACSSASNSEIVVPLLQNGVVMAVLDIDSTDFDAFDDTDKLYLEQIVKIIL
jgi:GAF domain-containing protein